MGLRAKVAVSRELPLFWSGATRVGSRDWSDGGCVV